MPKKYVLGIDQSTQGTKALLFDATGGLIARCDEPHAQIINEKGWVEHDPAEIFHHVVKVVRAVVGKAGIAKNDIAAYRHQQSARNRAGLEPANRRTSV